MSMQEDDLSDILARERAQEYDETPAGERETAIPTKWIWIGVGTLVLIVVVAVIYYLRDKAQNTSNGTQSGGGTQTASGVGGGWYQPTEGTPVDGGSTVPYGVVGNGGSNTGGTSGDSYNSSPTTSSGSGTSGNGSNSSPTSGSGSGVGGPTTPSTPSTPSTPPTTYTPPAARGSFSYNTASGGANTLSGIAKAYGDTVGQLTAANPGIAATGTLAEGTSVNIPGVNLNTGNAATKVTQTHIAASNNVNRVGQSQLLRTMQGR